MGKATGATDMTVIVWQMVHSMTTAKTSHRHGVVLYSLVEIESCYFSLAIKLSSFMVPVMFVVAVLAVLW